MSPARPLIDLLGARWTFTAPVVGAAWDATGDLAGFGLRDGTVLLAQRAWRGGPRLEDREGGGVALVPAREPPPPVSLVSVHREGCLALAGDGQGGFLSGGADRRLVRTDRDGATREVARFERHAATCVSGRGDWLAAGCGREVAVFGEITVRLTMSGAVRSLAFDPAGRQLAIAHEEGVAVWIPWSEGARTLARGVARHAVAWSPDGVYLAAAADDATLDVWQAPDGRHAATARGAEGTRSLSFSADGTFVAAGRDMGVACWRFDPAGSNRELESLGARSLVAATVVTCHPVRPVVAAGYANGVVLLRQPGSADTLFVREADGTPVTTLAWSADGVALATGTGNGEIGVVTFPDRLFRTSPSAASSGKEATQ